MNIEQFSKYLTNHNIEGEIIHHDKPIVSKNDSVGIFKIEETAPTLILDTDNGFIALMISGEREKIEFKQLKKLLNCKKLQLANPTRLKEELNLVVGQIPLVGHHLPTIFDQKLLKFPFVYGGTGDLFYTLKIKPQELLKASQVILNFE